MQKIDNRIVKASFRDCLVSERKTFKKSTCLMPISVGQKIHEGQKFLAAIKLINASFKFCTILVDDSVQRHTMKIDQEGDYDFLYHKAILEGDLWLSRNKESINHLSIPYKIMRWNDWLESPNYKNQYEKIENLYSSDKGYQEAINENIRDFLSRYLNRLDNNNFNYENAFAYCLDYLKEECVVMTLWTEEKYEFEVYPSGRNKAMVATYERLIKPFYPDLLRSVALRFKKYPFKLDSFSQTLKSIVEISEA